MYSSKMAATEYLLYKKHKYDENWTIVLEFWAETWCDKVIPNTYSMQITKPLQNH